MVRASERTGFFFVDSHCLLSTPRLDYVAGRGVELELVEAEDVPAIQEMSRSIFASSRYAWDPMLSEEGTRSLFDGWIANNCTSRADLCLLSRIDGKCAGYILNLWSESTNTATIDLIAVTPDAQGRGIGQALIAASFAHYKDRAVVMHVGTQGSNQGGHKLYRRCGFTLIANDVSLHRHRGGQIP